MIDIEQQRQQAQNDNTSPETLTKLANSQYPEVAEAAKLHINFAPEIEDDYEEKAHQIIASGLNNQKSYQST